MSHAKQTTITVARVAFWSVGVRLWFVVQATDGTRYQRWSLGMDSTDECLLIAQAGDTLNVGYSVRDKLDVSGLTQTNVISSADFK